MMKIFKNKKLAFLVGVFFILLYTALYTLLNLFLKDVRGNSILVSSSFLSNDRIICILLGALMFAVMRCFLLMSRLVHEFKSFSMGVLSVDAFLVIAVIIILLLKTFDNAYLQALSFNYTILQWLIKLLPYFLGTLTVFGLSWISQKKYGSFLVSEIRFGAAFSLIAMLPFITYLLVEEFYSNQIINRFTYNQAANILFFVLPGIAALIYIVFRVISKDKFIFMLSSLAFSVSFVVPTYAMLRYTQFGYYELDYFGVCIFGGCTLLGVLGIDLVYQAVEKCVNIITKRIEKSKGSVEAPAESE